jgi:GT2 family glycosyltransferase
VSDVDVVIVNWNSGRQLDACLASLAESALGAHELARVVVVDNASTDDSLARVGASGLPLALRVNAENLGFAAACNQGAALGGSEYVLFLNPDVVLEAHSIERAVEALAAPGASRVGACGIQLRDGDGRVSATCSRFPRARQFWWRALGLAGWRPELFEGQRMLEWDHRTSACVDQVMGAFLLIRRRLFEALRGFDERFFVYFEEVDLCLRLREAGYRTLFLAEASAFHRGGGTTAGVEGLRLYHSLRSRWLYGAKHFGRTERASLAAATFVVEPVCRLARAAWRRSPSEARSVASAYGRLARWLVRGAPGPPARPKAAVDSPTRAP